MVPLPFIALLALAAPAEAAPPSGRTVVHQPLPVVAPARVVPRSELVAPGASAAEVLGRLPGVQAERLGGPEALSRVRVRGSTPDQVRVLLDGVELTHADGSPVDLAELPLWDAERLVVWRSHAPLGRGGAIGGAVELQSRRPRGALLEAAVEGGSYGQLRLGAHGAWARDDGDADLSASVEVLRSEGDFPWQDDRGTLFDPTDDRAARRRNNDLRRVTGLLAAGGRAGRCRLRLLDHALAHERGLPGPATSPSLATRHARLANLLAASLACGEPDGWRVEGTAALGWHRSRADDPRGELFMVPSAAERDALAPSAALTVRRRVAPWLDLGAYGEAGHERYRLRDPLRPGGDAELGRSRAAIAAEAAVGLPGADLVLAPRVRLDAFDDGGRDGRGLAVTWQALAAWSGLADLGLRAWAGVGTGVRAPSLYELQGDGASVLPSPGLVHERALTGSATVAWARAFTPAALLVDLEVSAFASRVEDLIQLRRTTLQTAVADNVEAAALRGVEWSAAAELFRHLRLRWAHGSLWTESRSREAARRGRPLPLRPVATNHARLEGFADAPGGSGGRLFLDVDHVGSNTYDPAALVRAPARAFLGAGAAARWATRGLAGPAGELELAVIVRNLLDREAVDLVGYPLPGRSWAIRLAWQEVLF